MTRERPNVWFVIPAAGFGRRMQSKQAKQFMDLAGRPVLWHTLFKLLSAQKVQGGTVVLAENEMLDHDQYQFPEIDKSFTQCLGGETRSASVLLGLKKLLREGKHEDDWVLVHDAARPLVKVERIEQLIEHLYHDALGGILALPAVDTIKQTGKQGCIEKTLDRRQIFLAQTPQMFRLGQLYEALQFCLRQEIEVTDESSAMEAMGFQPKIILGDASNIKITVAEDLLFAKRVLNAVNKKDKS